MPATIKDPGSYPANRARRHPDCWVCAPHNSCGLAMEFDVDESGAVEGVFPGGAAFTGYPGLLHGGVISSLLDGAMTNCLMARGTPGLTARLEVRFLKPVAVDQPVTVRGWWEKSHGPLHILGADLRQDGEVRATAVSRFMDYPGERA